MCRVQYCVMCHYVSCNSEVENEFHSSVVYYTYSGLSEHDHLTITGYFIWLNISLISESFPAVLSGLQVIGTYWKGKTMYLFVS